RPSTEGSRGIFLVSCFTRVKFRGVWKLPPRHPSPEPLLCFQLQTQLLNLPVHPPTLPLQPLWIFPEEKETQAKEHNNSPHKTVHILLASSPCGKGLLTPPSLTKISTLEILILPAVPVQPPRTVL
ncbi:hypothetical protein ILYODFUR_025748, partial [Ilyodon furcidens]